MRPSRQGAGRSGAAAPGAVARVVASALTLGACTAWVGPTRTFAEYEAKAGATAGAALSAVQTARLVVDGARRDRMLGPYTSRVLAESEGAAAGAQATFDGLQPPPGARAGRLGDELDALLQAAVDELTALRVEARRGDQRRFAAHAAALGPIAADLERFEEAHE